MESFTNFLTLRGVHCAFKKNVGDGVRTVTLRAIRSREVSNKMPKFVRIGNTEAQTMKNILVFTCCFVRGSKYYVWVFPV